ncbi:MAG: hypothetical protein JWP72_1308 [Massilia sp.]|nr:hypothetical protein [Massilia sp.]MDB5792317.1 hypothetical protein [Massilia sp.]
MEPRIERRRAQCVRWLLYPLIALSACALAGLVSAESVIRDNGVAASEFDLPQKEPLPGH